MKKILIMTVSACCAMSLFGAMKLDNNARILLESKKSEMSAKKVSSSDVSGVRVLIKLNDEATVDDLGIESLEVVAQVGQVVAASVSLADLEALGASDAVSHVELDVPAEADLVHATAGQQTGVEYAWQGFKDEEDALPASYSGKGVICAIYDKGLDPNHIAFSEREDPYTSRVKGLYHFTGSNGNYEEKSLDEFTTDAASETHGTHVLGIMAGGYNGPGIYCDWIFDDGIQTVQCTNSYNYNYGKQKSYRDAESLPYSGVAYDSDILVGCGGYYQGNMLAMAKVVRDYAREHNQPAVINFSIGNQMGSKDGTSAFNQGLAELGKDIIIAVSASNTGAKKATISKTFNDEETSFRTLLVPESTSTSVGKEVELWSDTDQPFAVTLFTYDTASGERTDIATYEGTTNYQTIKSSELGSQFSGSLQVVSGVQNQNGRYLLTITGSSFKAKETGVNVGIEVSGTAGQRVDAQGYPSQWRMEAFGVEGFTKGSGAHSVNDFATAENVFCVGNYCSRNVWGKINTMYTTPGGGYGSSGISYRNIETGDTTQMVPRYIAPTSSYARLVDGRSLPTVSAPGSIVVSAYNRYYDYTETDCSAVARLNDEEYFWHYMSGTSQATPFFAGVCALWLEANPNLDYDGIMEVLANGGIYTDDAVESDPARYGMGKIDAYGGLKYIVENLSGVSETVTDSEILIDHRNGEVCVSVPASTEAHVALHTLDGVKVAEKSGHGNVTLAIDSLRGGIYLVEVSTPRISKTEKILVR